MNLWGRRPIVASPVASSSVDVAEVVVLGGGGFGGGRCEPVVAFVGCKLKNIE